MEALALANEIRLDRAAARKEIEVMPRPEAMECVAAMIADPPRHIRSLEVAKLLDWVPRVGRHRVLLLLTAAGVSELALTGFLTDRQRVALVDGIDGCVAAQRERRVA